jgi:oxygen-independent coproporphyrinogen-3 oxidase
MWLLRSKKPFIFTDKYDKILDYRDTPNMGLYIHIPFCKSLCNFCPYCKTLYAEDIAIRYKNALLKEIETVSCSQNEVKEVTSLYFGGGSPALIPLKH